MCLALTNYCIRTPARGGLILGFTGMVDSEIEPAIKKLAKIVKSFV